MIVLFPYPLWVVALIFFECCFILFAIGDDDDTWGIGATFSVLVVLGVLQYFTEFKVFTYVRNDPVHSATWLISYFLTGAMWSIIKWWFAEKARVRRAKINYSIHWRAQKTNAKDYKSTILVWIAYWPLSFIWTMLNDPFRRVVNWIYNELQRVYQTITDSVWSDE